MIKFAPILLALIYGYIMYRFSVWRTKSNLDKNSTLLADKPIKALTDKMAKSLDLPEIKVNIYEIEAVNGLAAPDGRIFDKSHLGIKPIYNIPINSLNAFAQPILLSATVITVSLE